MFAVLRMEISQPGTRGERRLVLSLRPRRRSRRRTQAWFRCEDEDDGEDENDSETGSGNKTLAIQHPPDFTCDPWRVESVRMNTERLRIQSQAPS